MKKFSSFLIVLLLMLTSFTAGAQEYPRGDVNQDGAVNISDVACLIDYLLTGTWPDEPVSPDEHEYVDLGLPSGTLWATCNVGANAPEEYGDYFAWGETEPKEEYTWENYKWCNGSDTTLTKYCIHNDYGYNGFVDGKIELDPEDDAAYVNWGPSWRMPSKADIDELIENCTWEWTQLNGMNGRLFTGPNGNTLFLPAAGCHHDSIAVEGELGDYWTRTLGSHSNYAFGICFSPDGKQWWNITRNTGFTVRAVRVPQN